MGVTFKIYNKHISKDQGWIESEIEDTSRFITNCINELSVLAGMKPEIKKDERLEDVVSDISYTVINKCEELEEYYVKRFKLQCVLDNMKYYPENNEWEE